MPMPKFCADCGSDISDRVAVARLCRGCAKKRRAVREAERRAREEQAEPTVKVMARCLACPGEGWHETELPVSQAAAPGHVNWLYCEQHQYLRGEYDTEDLPGGQAFRQTMEGMGR